MTAATLFENAMERFRDTYAERRFCFERDIVEAVHSHLLLEIKRSNLRYRVFKEYPMLEKPKEKRADLVIKSGGAVAVAAEFKYEPSHDRSKEFSPGKFQSSVVFWTAKDQSVKEDVGRVNTYIKKGKAETAYAILIDEGGYFYRLHESPPSEWRSEWRDWGNGVWVLWTKVTRS